MSAKHMYFSAKQREVLARQHGEPTFMDHKGGGLRASGMLLRIRRKTGYPMFAYASADGSEVLVGTGIGVTPPDFEDVVDLGPVGEFLGAFPCDGPAPVPSGPLRLPRARAEALLAGTLREGEWRGAWGAALSDALEASSPAATTEAR